MSDERITPRLPAVPPAEVGEDRAELDGRLREGVARYLQGFASERSDGGLIGPSRAVRPAGRVVSRRLEARCARTSTSGCRRRSR